MTPVRWLHMTVLLAGIVLDASQASALNPVFEAAQAATRAVTGAAAEIPALSWRPHLTLCYSTSEQPAPPVIDALGKELPACEVTIDKLSLIIQRGPELLWDWRQVGTAGLRGLASGRPISRSARAFDAPEPLSQQGAQEFRLLVGQGVSRFVDHGERCVRVVIDEIGSGGIPDR
jgi:hypothetical protein